MCNDKTKVMEMVKKNGLSLRTANEDLRADRDVVVAAVRQDGTALQYYRRIRGREWEYWHFPSAIMKEVRSQDCCNALEVAVPHGGCGFEEDFVKWCSFREAFNPKELKVRSTVGMAFWDREATLDAVGTYGLALACAMEWR